MYIIMCARADRYLFCCQQASLPAARWLQIRHDALELRHLGLLELHQVEAVHVLRVLQRS